MKITIYHMLISWAWKILLSKSLVIIIIWTVIKIQTTCLNCKTINNCLHARVCGNVCKWKRCSALSPCCPVNLQCLQEKNSNRKTINYCHVFTCHLQLRLKLWANIAVVFSFFGQKVNQFIQIVFYWNIDSAYKTHIKQI